MLRAVVPPVLAEALDWQALTLRPGSFVDSALTHQHTDLLYSAMWRDGGERSSTSCSSIRVRRPPMV